MKEKSFIKQNKNKIICFIVTLLLAAFTIYAAGEAFRSMNS